MHSGWNLHRCATHFIFARIYHLCCVVVCVCVFFIWLCERGALLHNSLHKHLIALNLRVNMQHSSRINYRNAGKRSRFIVNYLRQGNAVCFQIFIGTIVTYFGGAKEILETIIPFSCAHQECSLFMMCI